MELMSDYLKATNLPFMEEVESDQTKNKDYYEVITNPIWLKKSKFYQNVLILFIYMV